MLPSPLSWTQPKAASWRRGEGEDKKKERTEGRGGCGGGAEWDFGTVDQTSFLVIQRALK